MNAWDRIAAEYDNVIGETGDVYHRTYINPLMLKLVGSVRGKRVLDLACGNGYFSRILSRRGGLVTGVDFSKELIRIARSKGGNIDYFVNRAERLISVKSNSQDLVFSNMAFHDIKNVKGAIKECSRVLKRGGFIVFSLVHFLRTAGEKVKGDDCFFIKISDYLSERVIKPLNNESVYSKYEYYHRPVGFYVKELSRNGFVVTDLREVASFHVNGKPVVDRLDKHFKSEIPSFMIFKARKD